MFKNRKGFVFVNLSAIALLLAAIGLWYLHRAYVDGKLNNDLGAMMTDGKKALFKGEGRVGQTGYSAEAVKIFKQYADPDKLMGPIYPVPASSAPVRGGYYGHQ